MGSSRLNVCVSTPLLSSLQLKEFCGLFTLPVIEIFHVSVFTTAEPLSSTSMFTSQYRLQFCGESVSFTAVKCEHNDMIITLFVFLNHTVVMCLVHLITVIYYTCIEFSGTATKPTIATDICQTNVLCLIQKILKIKYCTWYLLVMFSLVCAVYKQ